MAFWGLPLKPDKVTPYVPSGDEPEKIHVSQVCIAPGAKAGAKATVLLKVGDSEPLAICCLREGSTDCMALDLILDQYSEFTVKGNVGIHLTGYYMPEYEIEGSDDEDGGYPFGIEEDSDEEHELGGLLGFDDEGVPIYEDEYHSGEDSDYSSDEEGDEDDDEDTDSDDEDEEEKLKSRGVIIEDITESEKDDKKKKNAAAAKGKAAAFEDDDVSGSDSEEESEEEEEEKKPAPPAKTNNNKKQQVGDKRKAAEDTKKPTATKQAKKEQPEQIPGNMGKDKVKRWPNGFEIHVQKQGPADGKLAKAGKRVVVNYIGKLKNGKKFDQNARFTFRLGVGEVIKGWDRGVEGMRVGDKRKLIVPPAMGYGSNKVGPIPSNSELHFDVELIDVKG